MITNVLGHCYHDDFLSTFKGADYRAFTIKRHVIVDIIHAESGTVDKKNAAELLFYAFSIINPYEICR